MSDPDQPLSVVPLNYQKPPADNWRPVRVAMAIYLLTAGVMSLTSIVSVFSPGGFRYAFSGGGNPLYSFTSFVIYVASAGLFLSAAFCFFLNRRSRGTLAILAQVSAALRNINQIWYVFIYQLPRTTTPPGFKPQMIASYSTSLLIPLALLYFIYVFNRYDAAQGDGEPKWT